VYGKGDSPRLLLLLSFVVILLVVVLVVFIIVVTVHRTRAQFKSLCVCCENGKKRGGNCKRDWEKCEKFRGKCIDQ